ncbi:hypothetical protein [Kineothrix sp. MB12-C1]|uniref:hypothetical protein n=1 Tax=Kineothrix sp. MB12-C1 TaxID=3070215 RepID=UPI0027D23646|nr:hypothetical protein [Kineothrix sp. MB12-C1]WMC93868.1 hypothetical protein RBB56_06290 [Kineothrix sp. MB12-C1]
MIILTKRKIMENKENHKKYCFDIAFEWEDILSEKLSKPIYSRSEFEFKFDEKCRGIWKKTGIPIFRIFSLFDIKRDKGIFMFDMATKQQDGIYNNKKYIPCLIDYYLDNEQYKFFINAYKKNPFVLVSSREVYEYFTEKKCPIKTYHFPLSLPDYYIQMEKRFVKEYDLVLFARQNPLLQKYVDKYEDKYPDFNLVRRKYENGHYIYYQSRTGKTVSYGDTREEYINLVRRSKIAVYSTPGMDETRKDANGWNQVTPHFLEEVAGQCHIIARYPDNADTRWYELSNICKCVQSYDEFESLMNQYLKEDVDIQKYNIYLEKHVTSQRAKLLEKIMRANELF